MPTLVIPVRARFIIDLPLDSKRGSRQRPYEVNVPVNSTRVSITRPVQPPEGLDPPVLPNGEPFRTPRIGLRGSKKAAPSANQKFKGGIWPRPRRGLLFGRLTRSMATAASPWPRAVDRRHRPGQ